MAIIRDFKELKSWQEARRLTSFIYQLGQQTRLKADYGLRDQLQRASVSIMSNIAEGFERSGQAEKVQYLNIARASCAEVRSILCVCEDAGYLSQAQSEQAELMCNQITLLITGFIKVIKERRIRTT